MMSSSTFILLPIVVVQLWTTSCSYSASAMDMFTPTAETLPLLENDHSQIYRDTPSPPWYSYKDTTRCSSKHRCRNSDQLPRELKCNDYQGAEVEFGYCITYDDSDNTFQFSGCHYFQSEGHIITEQGYVKLPDNVSELNGYMCRSMNRKGLLCSECIDGFGPALTSVGFIICSNCTNVWYGVPLYLIVELVPITVLYLIILAFQINLTSAPMTCFILYSHIILFELQYDRRPPLGRLLYQIQGTKLSILKAVYGTTNLEILRFIVPPFCISSKLQFIHISFLEYLPAFYPLCLILLTWVCIELHGRNFRPLVLAWKPFHRCFVRLRRGWSTRSDLIDVFASFFLLSCGKIMFQSLFFIGCQQNFIFNEGNLSSTSAAFYDPSIPCNDKSNIGLAILAVVLLCVFNILPALLLTLYPIKVFRVCLSKCKIDGMAVTTFVNKFHGCYRDSLDGGRDMRSFSGLYFFLRALSGCIRFVFHLLLPNIWLSYALLYLSSTLLIACAKPYKKTYMNVIDTIFLSILSTICLLLSLEYFKSQVIEVYMLIFVPAGLLALFVVVKLVTKKKMNLKQKLRMSFMSCRKRYKNMWANHEAHIGTIDNGHIRWTDNNLQLPVSSTVVSLQALC